MFGVHLADYTICSCRVRLAMPSCTCSYVCQERGADIHSRGENGFTVLCLAAYNGYVIRGPTFCVRADAMLA